ncbi:MAG TPA: transcription termination/antitermination NusG family protein, partial [Vicinamibacteria bacterium]|nr:transcription termination/antitermination NusG family protein [Vicinamibacteria bacterium]
MSTAVSRTWLEVAPEAGYGPVAAGGAAAPWHVLWTRSHCERLVQEQVEAKGYPSFLPMIEVWSRRRGQRHRIQVPLFPGYLFLNHDLDQACYVDVLNVRGLVRILGERWDRPAQVPAEEVEAIRRLAASA